MLRVEHLSRFYGKHPALLRLDFSLSPGEVVALLGPNGAGKSTAFRVIGGLLRPSDGEIHLNGENVTGNAAARRAMSGLVIGDAAAYAGMSVESYLLFFARAYGLRGPIAHRRLEEQVQALGLEPYLPVRCGALSHGLKQRLALARVTMHNPPVLLLDEPTNGLDPEAAQLLRLRLEEEKAKGRMIILATHLLNEAEALADRLLILNHGNVVASGTTAELTSVGGETWVRVGIAADLSPQEASILSHRLPALQIMRPGEFRVSQVDLPCLLGLLSGFGLTAQTVHTETRSLEDAYLEMIGAVSRASIQ